MIPTVQNRFTIRKRVAVSFVIVAIFIILLGLIAYFWLPVYLKSRIETILSETLHRPVTIQSIVIQPYSLEVSVNGFRIDEKASGTDANKQEQLFAFEKLYIDLSIKSIARIAPVITAVALEAPKIRLVREGENLFNITDLINKFTQPADDVEIEEPLQFSVSNILITDGQFEFVDQIKKSHQIISDIALGIPFIANFESAQTIWVEPFFSANINGAPFYLDGKFRPFADYREASLAIEFADFDLKQIDEYSPIPIGIKLRSGYIDGNLRLTFNQIMGEPPSIAVSGDTVLRELAVENRGVEAPYQASLERLGIQLTEINLTGQEFSYAAIKMNNMALTRENESASVFLLPKLVIDEIEIDMAKQQVTLNEVLLDKLNLSIRRQHDGNIDLIRLFTSQPHAIIPPEIPPETIGSGKAIHGIPIPGQKPAVTEKLTELVPIPGHKPPEKEIVTKLIPFPGHKPSVAERMQNNLQEISTNKTAKVTDLTEEALPEKQSWTTQINRIELTAASIQFEDETLTDVAPLVVSPLNLTLDKIDLSGATPIDLSLQTEVNQHGSIKTEGSIAWAPIATDLNIDLQAVDLVSLQGWVSDQFNAFLKRGAISFQGQVKANGEPLEIGITGEGQLLDFTLLDETRASDLLRWEELEIKGINFLNEPLDVAIDSIRLGDFFARVTILPEGNLNLKQIVRQEGENASAALPGNEEEFSPDQEIAINIDKIILQRGDVKFSDQFIDPSYQANLTELSGEIGPLSANKSGKIEIHGTVNKIAPLEILGQIDPFNGELYLDISAKAKNINLPPFSPYSSKYVGYLIEKGKLSVDVHYQVEDGVLKAENQVFLDQFTLGKETDSPDALSIPLRLAIALLKNRHGEINLHLPIEGSINDPQFSIGDIIFDAFVNLVKKAAIAPFALLGSVLGDGEELSSIEFKPGYAQIETEAEKDLRTLSQALIDRPALELEITGYADPVLDHEGLKQAILERKVKAHKLSQTVEKDETSKSLDEIELTSDEYSKFLELVYEEEEFDKPTNIFGFTKSLPVPEMEKLLLEHFEVSDGDLLQLAGQRANAAQNWLIEQGDIARDRIFVLGEKIKTEGDDQKPGNRAEFSLKI